MNCIKNHMEKIMWKWMNRAKKLRVSINELCLKKSKNKLNVLKNHSN